jgi:hypothetical protein
MVRGPADAKLCILEVDRGVGEHSGRDMLMRQSHLRCGVPQGGASAQP